MNGATATVVNPKEQLSPSELRLDLIRWQSLSRSSFQTELTPPIEHKKDQLSISDDNDESAIILIHVENSSDRSRNESSGES